MDEVWREIDGYGGLYQISSFGRVKNSKGLIMAQKPSKDGYVRIQLFKDKKYKAEYVHILVGRAFIPNPQNKPEINHIDADKSNNHVGNLEWVTRRENHFHAVSMGLKPVRPNIGKFGSACSQAKPILQYDLNGNFVKKWEAYIEAAKGTGAKASAISSCARGKGRTAGGYIWVEYRGGDIPIRIPSLADAVSSAKKENKQNARKPKTCKKVIQCSQNGEFLKLWDSVKQIEKMTGYVDKPIYSCCKKTRKSAYGYIWKYVDDLDVPSESFMQQ